MAECILGSKQLCNHRFSDLLASHRKTVAVFVRNRKQHQKKLALLGTNPLHRRHACYLYLCEGKGLRKQRGDIQISRPVNPNCYLPRCCPLMASRSLCADALTSGRRGGVISPELTKHTGSLGGRAVGQESVGVIAWPRVNKSNQKLVHEFIGHW